MYIFFTIFFSPLFMEPLKNNFDGFSPKGSNPPPPPVTCGSCFLPMVPGGGTISLQMDFLSFSVSSSSTPLKQRQPLWASVGGQVAGWVGWGDCAVDCGDCDENALLFSIPIVEYIMKGEKKHEWCTC